MKNEQPKTKAVPVTEAAAAAGAASASRKRSSRKKRAAETRNARPGTKKAAILSLLKRPKGATLKELMKATQWQAHSVRGFLSGSVGKKMAIQVQVIDRDGERAYHVKN